MSLVQEHVNTELVRFAVQTAITCPECRRILDVEDAVLLTHTGTERTAVCCGGCWDTRSRGLSVEQRAALDVIDTRPALPTAPRIKGKRGTVALAFRDGKHDVAATLYGALAVHRTGPRYTITHVATGFIVADDLRLDAARALVALLQPLDWAFTDPGKVPQATREQARDILRPFVARRRR